MKSTGFTAYLPKVRCSDELKIRLLKVVQGGVARNLADHIRFAVTQYVDRVLATDAYLLTAHLLDEMDGYTQAHLLDEMGSSNEPMWVNEEQAANIRCASPRVPEGLPDAFRNEEEVA